MEGGSIVYGEIRYNSVMKHDKTMRRHLIIILVVLGFVLGWPMIASLFSSSVNARTVSRQMIGTWQTDSLMLTLDAEGMCTWGRQTPEPCGFVDIENLPPFIASQPDRGAVYLISGPVGNQRAYRTVMLDADHAQLFDISSASTATFTRVVPTL